MTTPFYESDAAVQQYLLFHYGAPHDICPIAPEMWSACGYAVRCVNEPLEHIELRTKARALDLGCAVGRSSFELGRHFAEVVGIDFSERFIAEASRMRESRGATIRVQREGDAMDEVRIDLPRDIETAHVQFEKGDACNLRADLGTFDLVLMANLIDRLPDPGKCLARMAELISHGGWLVITSPYTWMEEYTPREKWLGHDGEETLTGLTKALSPDFEFTRALDLPFLIREHRRKYQWSIAEATLWQRRSATFAI